ncbi:MAG: sulfatase-like hydrolase/transferase [Proteobacteria bacterium]|nr:sulfatase-like hydrolase/transferase [Pseudomonadota bacterium]
MVSKSPARGGSSSGNSGSGAKSPTDRSIDGFQSRAFVPALTTLILTASAEGAVAAAACGEEGFFAALLGFLAGFSVLVIVLILPAILLGWLVDHSSVRTLGRGINIGLCGVEPGNPAVALVLGAIVISLSVAFSALAGRALMDAMTAPFAAFGEALVMIGALGLLTLFAALVGPVAIEFGRDIKVPRLPHAVQAAIVLFFGSGALLVLSLAFLPAEWAPLPTAAVAGLGIGLLPSVQRRAMPIVSGRRMAVTVVALVLLAVGMLSTLELLPGSTKRAILYRAPYAGTLLGVIHSLIDCDSDGFSGILLGGDCDDSNPRIHPGAHDVPGNGKDEDCSGIDARLYTPPKEPSFKRPASLAQQNNIVLIMLDALRPDHLGFNGYSRPTSPNIDRFHKESVWFSRAYTSAPNTNFALASTFTGYDFRKVPHRTSHGKRFTLLSGAHTVAEDLKKKGYDTVGFTISYVIHHIKGVGQGFRVWKTPWPTDDWRKAFGKAATITTDAAINYLNDVARDGSRPFLLFVHYRFCHDPYRKHDEWDFGDAPVDRYDSALAYGDREVGRLLATLDAREDRSRTAIIMCSDHGELFGDHGLTAHGQSLYEADARILLLARLPSIEPQVVDTPVFLTDLAPTILDLASLPKRGDSQGWSLFAPIVGGQEIPLRPLFLYTFLKRGRIHREASAVVQWPFKYIRDSRTHTEEIYNVDSDPDEVHNLTKSAGAKHKQLSELLDAYESYVANKQK